MFICILALDALDPFLVKRFRLRSIMQNAHGTVDVSAFPLVITPVIWACFITGKYPHEHGVLMSREWRIPIISSLFKSLMSSEENSRRISSIIGKEGIYKLYVKIPHWLAKPYSKEYYERKRIKTIFDYAFKAFTFDVPSYNQSITALKLKNDLLKVIEGRIPYEQYKARVWSYDDWKRDLLFKVLKSRRYDLIMFHFEITDLLGHLRRGYVLDMWRVYTYLNKMTREVSKTLPKDSLLLVVSDHGMRPLRPSGVYGDHSVYGFWSSNIPIGLSERANITDFSRIIIKLLRN